MNRLKTAKKLHTEEGATLVELLAAIAILSIVVMSFLAFFVQAGNTNNRTDKVNEATLLAQAEMEKITNHLQYNNGLNSVWTHYKSEDYILSESDEEFTLEISDNYQKKIIIKKPQTAENNEDGSKLYNISVEISEGGDTLAKMETWVPVDSKELQENSP